MLDKITFCKLVDELDYYVSGMKSLEESLNVMFDDNFLTKHLDQSLNIIAESFFTQEQLNDLDEQPKIETVKDILYHYAFMGEFGLKTSELQRLYVEDEGLKTEFMLNAFTSEDVYNIIDRYLNPTVVFKTCTINC